MTVPSHFLRGKPLMSAVTLVVIVVLVYFATKAWFGESATQYLTAKAARADIEETISATGVIRPSEQVAVGAQVSGQLKSLRVGLGDRVVRGQLLAEIDPVLQKNELRRAEAQLVDVRAQRDAKSILLRQYQAEEIRQAYMLRRDATSQADYDQAKANVDMTIASIESLAAQISVADVAVATANANLAYTRITAPMDGEVISVVTQVGQTLVSAQVAPVILILANLDTMTVRAKISEADVVRARVGLLVYFSILGAPDSRYESKLRAIETAPESIANETSGQPAPQQTSTAVYYNGLFDIRNVDHALRTSMTAQVRIVLGQVKNAVTIPIAALGKRLAEKRYEVRVMLSDGELRTRKITVGHSNDTNAEVLDGLAENEQVVVGDSVSAAKADGPGR